jgi:hypothetical protein
MTWFIMKTWIRGQVTSLGRSDVLLLIFVALPAQDEVSMLSAELLQAVIRMLRMVRRKYNKETRDYNLDRPQV